MNGREYQVTINGIEVDASFSQESIQQIFIPLLEHLAGLHAAKGSRIVVMFAAPPGAGKSTLVSFLETLAKEIIPGKHVQAIGMDGFHKRQEYLLTHETRVNGQMVRMVDIKGAPITFDLERLTARIRRVASGEIVGWPTYNRHLHNPEDNKITVDADIVLLEGNYLLLDQDGWKELSSHADYTISLRADEELLRGRLVERKMASGSSREVAEKFVDSSDMVNARLCLAHTRAADLNLVVTQEGIKELI